jgi:hypothetical protein
MPAILARSEPCAAFLLWMFVECSYSPFVLVVKLSGHATIEVGPHRLRPGALKGQESP